MSLPLPRFTELLPPELRALLVKFASRGTNYFLRQLSEFSIFPQVQSSSALAAVSEAIRGGHLNAVKALQPIDQRTIYEATKYGHLAVAQWLHEVQGIVPNSNTFKVAAAGGFLALAQWLYSI